MWTIEVVAPAAAVPAVEAAIEPFCTAVASFEAFDRGPGCWLVTGYASEEPGQAELESRVALTASLEQGAVSLPAVRRLPETDWLAENRRSFRPVRAGRYLVLPKDAEDRPDDGTPPGPASVVIRLNAGPAFGSGTHQTTQGCLIALDRLARGRRPRRLLDLGTGSGILAIAAAKTWSCSVVATDIDPVAARTTLENAAENGVSAGITILAGPGFRPVSRMGRFDLVVANIQARPLVRLAEAMRRHAQPGAPVVLSGLLNRDAPHVQAAYRARGFAFADRIRIGDWTTLILFAPTGAS